MIPTIPDEPVRGRTPPPWFQALSGIERMRTWSQGLFPWPPISRLLGLRTTHVVPGAVTVTMPATEASITSNGQLEVIPLMVGALEGACTSALLAGQVADPLLFAINPFRPARAQPGNLLARARILNSGRRFVFAELQLEDPEGRHVAQGTLQAAIRRVELAPPPPPDPLPPVDEPVYQTPDPYLRNYRTDLASTAWDQRDGLEVMREFAAGVRAGTLSDPVAVLYGLLFEEVDEGRIVLTMPASEWFCWTDRHLSSGAIAGFGDMAGWGCAHTIQKAGTSVVGLDANTRFLRPVVADGRRLVAENRTVEHTPGLFLGETRIHDADGQLVAITTGAVRRLDLSQRSRRRQTEPKRVLATLLFTDIVDSTAHAERLGDAGWRALLEEQRVAIRREVSRYNGTELDTAGDGFFVRFDSPGSAIAAARAARTAASKLGVDIRAGVHTGECEVDGAKLAGMAVHVAARIQGQAKPGELLVSSTVKDLAAGAGLRFEDLGEQALKGVPDPWRLYKVLD
ncbi:MAG: adenylate/guanylate cyclase domain-containing protein [Deltaproteobacteria bacterium]|nr:adenylate/guanylate cyclase domain-containing protein [Deltaproteobacteria bacterium]